MVHRFEAFLSGTSELHRYLNKIMNDEMTAYGLKGPYSVYLIAIYRHPGATCAELSEICARNKADTSRALAVFEENGLIVRKGGSANSYRAQIFLTEKGLDAATKLKERVMLAVAFANSDVAESDRKIFYDVLEKFSRNIKKMAKDGIPESASIFKQAE